MGCGWIVAGYWLRGVSAGHRSIDFFFYSFWARLECLVFSRHFFLLVPPASNLAAQDEEETGCKEITLKVSGSRGASFDFSGSKLPGERLLVKIGEGVLSTVCFSSQAL